MHRFASRFSTAALLLGMIAGSVSAQVADLAGYFGFTDLEIVKIGRRAGPIGCADMNADGLVDLIAVNNHASRIELHYQKPHASPSDGPAAPVRVNEFPEHWRFRRQLISVAHEVATFAAHDFDGDGLMDLIYAGAPAEIVFMRQTQPGVFDVSRRHRVKDLSAGRDGLAVADVLGDEHPELLGLVRGVITVWPLQGDRLGTPIKLRAAKDVVAILLEDFNGDGRLDVAGIIPEDPSPVRLWIGGEVGSSDAFGAQMCFEMPAVVECSPFRLPGRPDACLAVIERASKRLVLYELATEQIAEHGDREAAIRVHGFTDSANRQRDHAIVDIDGDGRLDFVATDTEANAVVVYRQQPGEGLQAGQSFASLSELDYLVAGNVDDDPMAELFVLSEEEGIVGRSDVTDGGTVPFPAPQSMSAGYTPTALNLIDLEDGPRLAVIAKDGRDHVIDLVGMAGDVTTVSLGKLSRSPEAIVAVDADQDGRSDLLLFTRDKPMMMLRAGEEGFVLIESKDMGQYGLVQAAASSNVTTFDIDGDGRDELLVADKNFVRAVRYDPQPPGPVSPGWQVVEQINAPDSSSKLVSLAIHGDRIVAADKANNRLVFMGRSEEGWRATESLTVRGFSFSDIHAGAFSGGGRDNILAVGEGAFAIVRLVGDRAVLREFASWRTTEERRMQHELAFGDVNGDGFLDMIALDAGEQMCEIFTFSQSGSLLYATGFQVYESKRFTGGEGREYQPSQAIVVDLTGDGADDLVMLAHDRVLIYPQMTQAAR